MASYTSRAQSNRQRLLVVGAGNWAPYPSEILPLRRGHTSFGWLPEDADVMRVCLEETHRRALEAFYSHRINGGDNETDKHAWTPMKKAHPEWLINCNPDPNGEPQRHSPWEPMGYWNFAVPEVRQY